jgi:OOP family OmpA-OmpF porin
VQDASPSSLLHCCPRLARAGLLALCSWLALGALPARAQRDLQVDDYRPAHDARGFLSVQGTATPGHLRWNVGLFTHYTFGLLRVNPAFTTQQVVVRDRLSMDALFQLGLGGRFALTAEVPFTPFQTGAPAALADGGQSLDGAALGDVRLSGRVRLLGDAAEGTATRSDGPGLAGMLTVTLPTAQGVGFHGSDLPEIAILVIADFHILNLGIGASVGARIRPERVSIAGRQHGSELLWGLGIAMPLPFYPDLVALLEFRGSSGFTGRYNTPTEVDLGLRFRLGSFHLSMVGGVGFPHRALGAPSVRAILGLQYAPQHQDQDLDTVPDSADECPLLPEDFDGFQDDDGCMDPDNDNDLIPDVDDLCPNATAEEDRDDDEDGCTDR